MNKAKAYVKEASIEFRQILFKRPLVSRVRWSIATLITFALAYYAHTAYLSIGGGTPDDPWANPTGQLFLAIREVGVVTGSVGLLFMVILGLGDNESRTKEHDHRTS